MARYFEIVELSDGSFVLQSSDGEDAPLVRIEFSAEAETLLQGQTPQIAKAMIGAGVEAAGFINEEEAEEEAATLH